MSDGEYKKSLIGFDTGKLSVDSRKHGLSSLRVSTVPLTGSDGVKSKMYIMLLAFNAALGSFFVAYEMSIMNTSSIKI